MEYLQGSYEIQRAELTSNDDVSSLYVSATYKIMEKKLATSVGWVEDGPLQGLD